MELDFSYDPSVANAPGGFRTALATAAQILDQLIADPIRVTLQVGYGEVGGSALSANTLAEAAPEGGTDISYGLLTAELRRAATSADDNNVVNSLPTYNPAGAGTYYVTPAQEKAWGLMSATSSELDGEVGFSSSLAFDYDPTNRAAPKQTDFVGVALHELTHALGRYVSDAQQPVNTALTLVSYGSNGLIDPNAQDTRYLSLDGGKTDLATFDTTSDPSDYSYGTPDDSFGAYAAQDSMLPLGMTDERLLDVLGFNVNRGANFTVTDTTTNTTSALAGATYAGPVSGVQQDYINLTSDSLNITSRMNNVFIRSGAGTDALNIQDVGGRNVLDGSYGSNFLEGSQVATARDSFFVDDRNAAAAIWSTMANVHIGDDATVWGVTPSDFKLDWADNQGAAGFQGLTLHVTAPGVPAASLTLSGFTTADLNNGRLTTQYGSVDGSPYLYIKDVG